MTKAGIAVAALLLSFQANAGLYKGPPLHQLSQGQAPSPELRMSSSSIGMMAMSMPGDVAIAGHIPGQSSVTPSGVARYSIPVPIPRSLAGFGPSLSIEYNSQSQSGLLGVGWNVSGIEQITRCPQTKAQDNAIKGVSNAATDRFCMGGARLIKVSGETYGGDGSEYRTELESFSKIVSYGTSGSGPLYFKVWAKDGRTLEFGNTADSRLKSDIYSYSTHDYTIQAWSLNKVTDRSSNYWTVTYSSSENTGVLYPNRIDYSGNVSAAILASSGNSVRFNYEDRPVADQSLQYIAGSRLSLTRRLTNLKAYSGETLASEFRFEYESEDSGGNGYDFSRLKSIAKCNYDGGVAYCVEPTELTWTSDASVQVSNGVVTKKATALGVVNPRTYDAVMGDINGDGKADLVFAGIEGGILKVRSMLAGSDIANAEFGNVVSGEHAIIPSSFGAHNYYLSDMDLDGKADLVAGVPETGGMKVYLLKSNGDGTFAGAAPTQINLHSSARLQLADVNSDGVTDYVLMLPGWSGVSMKVALRTPYGAVLPAIDTVRSFGQWADEMTDKAAAVAEMNGDGYPDLVVVLERQNGDYVSYVYYGYGDGTFGAPSSFQSTRGIVATGVAGYQVVLQDVNRDGLVDVLLDQALEQPYCIGNSGTNACPSDPEQRHWDLCRDVGCSLFTQKVKASLNKGTGLYALYEQSSYETIGIASSSIDEWMPTYGDIDSDGALDVVRVAIDDNNIPWILVNFGQGNGQFFLTIGGFLSDTPLMGAEGLLGGATISVQNDVNADGIADIVIPMAYKNTAEGERVAAFVTRIVSDITSEIQQQNLLSAVTQSSHVRYEFDYGALPSSSGLYVKGTGATFPVIDLQAPLLVVSKFRSILSDVVQSESAYFYEGAKADITGRGFLGFKRNRITTTRTGKLADGNSQVITEVIDSEYLQEFPFIGQPVSIDKMINGVLVESYDISPAGYGYAPQEFSGVYHIHPVEQEITNFFDPESGEKLGTYVNDNSFFDYDEYGNRGLDFKNHYQMAEGGGNWTLEFLGSKRVTNSFHAADTSSWKINLISSEFVQNTKSGSPDVVHERQFFYDSKGLLNQVIREPNDLTLRLQTDIQRDVYGNVTHNTQQGAGPVEYPEMGITTRTTEWKYEAGIGYPAGVFQSKVINPLGHQVSRTFNPLTGAVNTETDSNGLTISFEFDALGREISRTNPDGTSVVTLREACADPVALGVGTDSCEVGEYLHVTTTRTGFAPSHTFFDALGRELRSAVLAYDNTNFIVVRKEYDAAGRLFRQSDPALSTLAYSGQKWTVTEYDASGRVVKVVEPGNRITTHEYDVLQKLTTNAKAQVRAEIRDIFGRVLKVKDANDGELLYELDALGRVTKTTDAKGNSIVFGLDKYGNKTRQEDPDLGIWNYRYNVLGELVWQQDAKQQQTTFAYDKLGRMVSRLEVDASSVWQWDTATNDAGALNAKGKLARVTGAHGYDRSYVYDSFSRLKRVVTNKSIDSNAVAGSPDYVYQMAYDSSGRVESYTYPSGFAYKNIFDANGYLSEVQNLETAELLWRATKRDANNRVTREKFGNNLFTDRVFQWNTGYLDTVVTGNLSGGVVGGSIQNDAYVFDDLGNLSSRMESANGKELEETFLYDDLNRLTDSVLNNGNAAVSKSVQYDAIGNVTWKSDVGVMAYNPSGASSVQPHAVQTIDGIINRFFSYDDNGNMTADGDRTIQWTAANYPKKISKGSAVECFFYSPDSERVRRTADSNCAGTSTVYINPRIDTGGTYEKHYLPGGVIEQVNHLYADGRVLGAVVQRIDPSLPVVPWSNPLTVDPETVPVSTSGINMPASDPNNLVAWSNTAAPGETPAGRLAVYTRTTSSSQVAITGDRSYLDQSVVFRAEIRTSPNQTLANGSGGRYLQFGAFNNGTSNAPWLTARRHQVYFNGSKAYASIIDGKTVDGVTGDLKVVNIDLDYPLLNDTTYVAEIETTPAFSTLYLYKKGEARNSGARHNIALDWKGTNGTLTRKMRILASGAASAANVTYIDNLSESPSATVASRRYFHGDHLNSVVVTTDEFGEAIESLSYDAWGKRRHPDGRDDILNTSLWEVDFDGAGPTSNSSNPTGIQLPGTDPLQVFQFDDATDRLVVNRRAASGSATTRAAKGTRSYDDVDAILFRARVTTSTAVGTGRYAVVHVYTGGTSAEGTLRRFGVKLTGTNLYATYLADPAIGATQQLLTTGGDSLADNTPYILEIHTDKAHNVLYFYPEGGDPADGWTYTIDNLEWEAGADKKRFLRIEGQETSGASPNPVYIDLMSETKFEPQSALAAQSTRHGFTLHEHLDTVDVVHMNGRIYNPQIGRFMSPDPNVFHPDNMQDYNRYSYVLNNPLTLTDPSGFTYGDPLDLDAMDGIQFGGLEQINLQTQIDRGSSMDFLQNPFTGSLKLMGPNYQFNGISEGPYLQVAGLDDSFVSDLYEIMNRASSAESGRGGLPSQAISASQARLAEEGRFIDYYKSRWDQNRDPIARTGLIGWGEPSYVDAGFLERRAAQWTWNRLESYIESNNVSVTMEQLGISLARAHRDAVISDTLGVPGLLSPMQAANYHYDVFRRYGIPDGYFGGTVSIPFVSVPSSSGWSSPVFSPETYSDRWCNGCDTVPVSGGAR